MKKTIIMAVCLLTAIAAPAQRKNSLETGWKFHRGGVINAEMVDCDDSAWRTVTLPHDYSMEPVIEVTDARPRREQSWDDVQTGPFTRLNYGDSDQGQTVGGEGWYRKTLVLPVATGETLDDYLGRTNVSILFDGIYNQAEVWVNGQKAAMNVHGYMPFAVSLNEVLKHKAYRLSDEREVRIAVRSLNTDYNSRWYTGSGIYRRVWLVTTGKQHLDPWDVFVDGSQLTKGKDARVTVTARVFNDEARDVTGNVNVEILDAGGNTVASTTQPFHASATANGRLDDKGVEMTAEVTVKAAHRWSDTDPYRYTARLSVVAGGTKTDELDIPFGIRTLEFSAKEGFKLNGKQVKLKGGCVHHDNGLLGSAAIERAEVRKAELLKEQGFNAVRCSHNMPTEAFLNACDSIGLMVIDEVFDQWEVPKRPDDYSRFFSKEKQQIVDGKIVNVGTTNFEYDAALMVRRDRNHPSVIIWSIGNEIYQRGTPRGQEIARIIGRTIKNLDSTRPTTLANCTYWDQPGKTWEDDSPSAFEDVDLAAYNYTTQYYAADHEKFPERIIVGTESYPGGMAGNWNFIDEHPYVIGDFVWTAIDYVGEAGIGHTFERSDEGWVQLMSWPWFNAWCGDIDLTGDKKPQSYYRDVLWGRSKIEMAVRPAIPEGEHEDVRGWGWTAEERHWNWDNYLPIELRPENYQIASTIRMVKHDINARRSDSLRVNVYSREKRVRLLVNGRTAGEKEVDPGNYTASFMVAYEPGELRAEVVGKASRHTQPASVTFNTAKTPAAIQLKACDGEVSSSHNDLAYIAISIVDEDGHLCPTAELPLNIETSGVRHVAVAGTGHPFDMKSFRSLKPKSFRGKAILIIQPQDERGKVNVKVTSPGLSEGEYEIELR